MYTLQPNMFYDEGYRFPLNVLLLKWRVINPFYISCEGFQPVFHQAVYRGIFTVLYSLSVFFFYAVFL